MNTRGADFEGKTRRTEEVSASLLESKAVVAASIQSTVVEEENLFLLGSRRALRERRLSAAEGVKL